MGRDENKSDHDKRGPKNNWADSRGVSPIEDESSRLTRGRAELVRQLGLRSRSGLFLGRRRNFLHLTLPLSLTLTTASGSTAPVAVRRSRTAYLGRDAPGAQSLAAGRPRLAAVGGGHLARLARVFGSSRAGRSRCDLIARGLLAAPDLRCLAAPDLGWLATISGFSGTAESGQDCEGRAQRDQLQNATHVVSLSTLMSGRSRPSIEENK